MKMYHWVLENRLLTAILLVGLFLRLFKLDFQSVWLDEVHTLSEANPNFSFSEMYDALLIAEPHPPLYFIILKSMFSVFGYTSYVLRIFSVIVGMGGIFAIYALGKEIYSRNVGLFAAAILSVSVFHIYYSQEGRMYALLLLTTMLSFYALIRFVKLGTMKWAVWHGILAGLMINSHFFGLLTLFTEYILLLFFFILQSKNARKNMLTQGFVSFIITALFFLPAIKLFIKSLQMKETWIPMPTADAYYIIFKEFFGNFEMLITTAVCLLLLYFVKLTKEKDALISYEGVILNRTILSFVVLVPWIILSLLIALIKSHVSLPVLISRYFIGILPAIFILLAIALDHFSNRILRTAVLSFIIITSLTDLFFVKQYYSTTMKAQFREMTHFITTSNKRDPVVSDRVPYLIYFLQNDKVHYELINSSLDAFASQIQTDTTKIRPFWFANAHALPYTVSDETKAFLDAHFYIDANYEGYDAWAKHYILLKDAPRTVNISKFGKLKPVNGDQLLSNIDVFTNDNNKITISGWACFPDQDATNTNVTVVVIKDGKALRLQTERNFRTDVTVVYGKGHNLDNAGFIVTTDFSRFPPGDYVVGIYATNNITKKESLVVTDKVLSSPSK
ncbi:MAG TPA: glycosyltransferase family 39 protein [Flavobacterium sp.]|jgi:uncharacterized membrane protein